jgi:predicted DNA binding protein
VGVRSQVIPRTDAQFPTHSPLNRLTGKQQRVFVTAYSLGYYDVLKKISLVQLAERLHVGYVAEESREAVAEPHNE